MTHAANLPCLKREGMKEGKGRVRYEGRRDGVEGVGSERGNMSENATGSVKKTAVPYIPNILIRMPTFQKSGAILPTKIVT